MPWHNVALALRVESHRGDRGAERAGLGLRVIEGVGGCEGCSSSSLTPSVSLRAEHLYLPMALFDENEGL